MSTKTTFKRIALVAVAAMGFGVLTSVAPANAASTISSITVGSVSGVRPGQAVIVPITVNLSSVTASETLTVAVKATSAPLTGGAANAQSIFNSIDTYQEDNADSRLAFTTAGGAALGTPVYGATTGGDVTDDTAYIGAFLAGSTTAGNLAADGAAAVPATAVQDATVASTYSYTYYVRITPDLAGTYTFLVSASTTSGNLSYVAGDSSTTLTVTTSGAPTSVVLTNVGGTTNYSGTYGSLVKVALKDAAGNAAQLAGDEGVSISVSSGYIAEATVSSGNFTSVAPTAGTAVTLSASEFVNGIGFINVKGTTSTGSTQVLTAAGTGTLSSSVATTLSVTTAKTATITTTAWAAPASATAVTSGLYDSGSNTIDVKSTATSTSIELTFTDPDATATGFTTIKDVRGVITGAPGTANVLYFDKSFTAADGDTYTTLSVAHSAIGVAATAWSFTHGASNATTEAVSGAASATTAGTLTVTPSTVRLATGGSISYQALVKDQFKSALSNTSVTVTVSGRNTAKASQTIVTDATGYISYTLTDTGTNGTTDTVTFNAGGTATADASIVYGATTVGTVTVTGGNTADTTATTYTAISTGNIGYSTSGAVAFTATVKDADGNLLVGVPVTFAVDKGLILKTATTDYTTVYTGAAGTATTYAFNWKTEKQTVTATAGAKSGTGHANWSGETNTTARVLTASASGNVVTFKAVDRFGNPVNGVVIALTRTGTGFFSGGTSTSSATTDQTGEVSVQFTGSGTVTGTLTTTYAEAYDVAGEVGETALKAAVAGTTTGTGASFAPAGVAKASVAVEAGSDTATTAASAAADAAAEATDAANAATDAANAAAEAADAATAAAQDAADAVAALSTQVTEMVSALKKQITALTNLVIKIQKKVKA